MDWLVKNKTLIGMTLLSLLGLIGSVDALVHQGHPSWLTIEQYGALGTIIAGMTGAALKIGLNRTEAAVQRVINKVDTAIEEKKDY